VSIQNSATLVANFAATITCPAGHFAGTTAQNGTCRTVFVSGTLQRRVLAERSFYIGVGALGAGPRTSRTCRAVQRVHHDAGAESVGNRRLPTASYWDIGVRGDTGPTNHASTVTLTPKASFLTNISGYPGGGTGFRVNSASNPAVASQYCNGSRIPPEFGGSGWQVPPGIADATVPTRSPPDAGRHRRRGQQLDQHQLGSAGDDEPGDQR